MATVKDVAEAILERKGPMDTFRLQKLVYYAQALHLATTGQPLFADPIEAWTNGPVVRSLYELHRGSYSVGSVGGAADQLDSAAVVSIDTMLDFYGEQSSGWLVNQVHLEDPWRRARNGLEPEDQSSRLITTAEMERFYGPVFTDPEVAGALEVALSGQGLTAQGFRQRYMV
jgi:uncharacterized phage-associated protein